MCHYLYKTALLIVVLFIFGCSSINVPKVHGKNVSGKSISSYVKWNDNYAVTVKHAGNLKNSSYVSTNYDVQFIRIDLINNEKVIWNNPKNNEKLIMFGYTRNQGKVYRYGNDAGIVTKHLEGKPKYRLVDTLIKKGMSGGPVFNEKNEVVGINIGYTAEKIDVKGKYAFYSLYLPYDIIQEEWIKSGLN